MIYFLKFLIIYLLFSNTSMAANDLDDSYGDGDNDDYNSVSVNRREITNRKNLSQNFVGSNLFGSGIFSKKCFSVEDVALLSARCKFGKLAPNITMPTNKLEDDKSVEVTMEYLYGLNELLSVIEKDDIKYFTQQAVYDIVGGYLNYYYWPLVKYSYYAGMLTYNSTINVYNLHKRSREILNTIGNGWRHSINFFEMKLKIEPINPPSKDGETVKQITTGRDNPCESLLLISEEDYTDRYETELIVSLPKIVSQDNDGVLNIRLPFKRKQNYNLNSKGSAFILLKYYVCVTKCYEFRKEQSTRFDRRFQKLMKDKFLPFVQSQEFYPGFGAILRISETLNHRIIVSRNVDENYVDNFLRQSEMDNQSNPKSDDAIKINSPQNAPENNCTFYEKIIGSMTTLEGGIWDDDKEIKVIFFILVTVVCLALVTICFCIIMKRRAKKKKTKSNESNSAKNTNCFKSFIQRFKKKPKNMSQSSVHEFNIGPRSSSILHGNEFEDTESRISSQTSGLSLKDLIHAEISKRPLKPSKEQIKSLSASRRAANLKEPNDRS